MIPDKATQEKLELESVISRGRTFAKNGYEFAACDYFEGLAAYLRAYGQLPDGDANIVADVLEKLSLTEPLARRVFGRAF